MARRRKKGRGRKKGAIPIAQVVTVVYPAMQASNEYGFKPAEKGFWEHQLFAYTGYSLNEKKWLDPMRGIGLAALLMAESTLGRKIANRSGANRIVRKVTGNLAQIM